MILTEVCTAMKLEMTDAEAIGAIIVTMVVAGGIVAGVIIWTIFQWTECRGMGFSILYCLKHIS